MSEGFNKCGVVLSYLAAFLPDLLTLTVRESNSNKYTQSIRVFQKLWVVPVSLRKLEKIRWIRVSSREGLMKILLKFYFVVSSSESMAQEVQARGSGLQTTKLGHLKLILLK